MAFPLLARELTAVLRRKKTFVWVGAFYFVCVLQVSLSWGILAEVQWSRTINSRYLFYGFLIVSYLGLSLQAAAGSARSLVSERENKTEDLLKAAPISPASIVLQKGGAPLAAQWLLLLGALPFLALVFLVGGIGGGEFVYQLINLGVWLNTFALAGLACPGKTRSSRLAALLVICLVVGQFGVATNLGAALDWFGVWEGWDRWAPWARLADSIPACISPIWMASSWQGAGLALTPLAGFRLLEACPALLSWTVHLGLQAMFFSLALGVWKRPAAPAVTPKTKTKTKKKSGRRSRSTRDLRPLPDGSVWKIFREVESRRNKRTPGVIKVELFLVFPLGLAVCLVIAVLTGNPVGVYLFLVLVFLGLCSAWAGGSAAFLRERKRNTAFFLLVAPISPREAFLGVWAYHARNFLLIVLFGVSLAVPTMAVTSWEVAAWFLLITSLGTVAFIPVVTWIGVWLGFYPSAPNWILPAFFLFLCCGGWNFFGFIVFPLVLGVAVVILLDSSVAYPGFVESRRMTRGKALAGAGLMIALVADIVVFCFAAVSGGPLGVFAFAFSDEASGLLLTSFFISNFILAPPCLAFAGWTWISRKSPRWWREKLLVGGSTSPPTST